MVKSRVAVRAYGSEVSHRINLIVLLNTRQGIEVMDMDEAGHRLSVHDREVEAAEETVRPIMPDALVSSAGIAFVAIDPNALRAAFAIC
jgi:hypothetical protein